jgi:hypothetical protein
VTSGEPGEKKKTKLKQLLGNDYLILKDLQQLDNKKKEKLQKIFGLSLDPQSQVDIEVKHLVQCRLLNLVGSKECC